MVKWDALEHNPLQKLSNYIIYENLQVQFLATSKLAPPVSALQSA